MSAYIYYAWAYCGMKDILYRFMYYVKSEIFQILCNPDYISIWNIYAVLNFSCFFF